MSDIAYKYIGDGSWLPGFPARDLRKDEIENYDTKLLDASPLYEKVKPPKKKKKAAGGDDS